MCMLLRSHLSYPSGATGRCGFQLNLIRSNHNELKRGAGCGVRCQLLPLAGLLPVVDSFLVCWLFLPHHLPQLCASPPGLPLHQLLSWNHLPGNHANHSHAYSPFNVPSLLLHPGKRSSCTVTKSLCSPFPCQTLPLRIN